MKVAFKSGGLALGVTALLFTACASPPKVRVDKDSSTNFDAYKSFSWLVVERAPPPSNEPKPIPGQEPPPINTIADNRVHNAVVTALQAKGYVLNDSNPDFRVSYALNVYEKKKDSGMRIGLGAGGGGGGNVSGGVGLSIPVGATKNTMGTMTIDIIDGKRNAQVWTGTYERKVEPEGVSDETANKIVSAILERFPNDPGKKKK